MPWTRWAVTVAGFVLLATVVVVERSTLHQSVDVFAHLHYGWLPLAVLAETASMAVFALAQRHLVVVAGHGTPVGHAVRTAYAGNAISGSIPVVGSQLGTLFTFRAYRHHGVDGPTVAWALAIAGVLSALAYGIVASSGAVLSGNPFATAAIAGSSVVFLSAAGVGWWALRRESLRPALTHRAVRVVAWRQRVTKRSLGQPDEIVLLAFERFDALRPRRADYLKVFSLTLLNAIGDVACLGLCILAVGAGVPWTRLILVWVAGSTAKGVPFTPGGIGFVEGAIALALVGSGLHPATATAAALLYRVVSFWMIVAIGWLVVAVRRLRHPRVAPTEPHEESVAID
jgi:uncharacterized membrane protein YbhN (UPF0104 family)